MSKPRVYHQTVRDDAGTPFIVGFTINEDVSEDPSTGDLMVALTPNILTVQHGGVLLHEDDDAQAWYHQLSEGDRQAFDASLYFM